ncbi:MAG: hypothetical protein ACI91J_003427, partial [Yoonia sp.]
MKASTVQEFHWQRPWATYIAWALREMAKVKAAFPQVR